MQDVSLFRDADDTAKKFSVKDQDDGTLTLTNIEVFGTASVRLIERPIGSDG